MIGRKVRATKEITFTLPPNEHRRRNWDKGRIPAGTVGKIAYVCDDEVMVDFPQGTIGVTPDSIGTDLELI